MTRKFCIIIAVLAAGTPAWAQSPAPLGPHNAAEEKACSRDAKRLCKHEIPDQLRVASCLQAHRTRVSRACRAALEGQGM